MIEELTLGFLSFNEGKTNQTNHCTTKAIDPFIFYPASFAFLYSGIKAMGCRNSPLTIKPYPMKIRGEYIGQFLTIQAYSRRNLSYRGYTLIQTVLRSVVSVPLNHPGNTGYVSNSLVF